MSYEFLIVQTEGHVTTITLNRPAQMNAIHNPMHWELQRALDAFAEDDTQYVGVITGAGDRAFCAGGDLKEIAIKGDSDDHYPKSGFCGLNERFDLTKPLIASVNGLALGGGFEFALCCDLIIASENAEFALPETLIGGIARGGGIQRIARQIGMKQAMGLLLTSRRVSAAEGFRLGFVNEVVPQASLREATARWCEMILKGAPLAVRATKDTLMRGIEEPSLAEALRNLKTYAEYGKWWVSEDRIEGPRSFAEKRPPRWKGR